ncbi:MAG: tetratricopeptide repeat protein [Clostridia bacterium]|nr:tetratricopeptide repeat protein [Clostridia bacterium]
MGNTKAIDFSRKTLGKLADKFYNDGKFLPALRLAHKEQEEHGNDPDVFARLADIYEAMGLHGSAINCLFQLLDIAHEDDLPEVYESLAVNFLNLGNESQSAYYYNKLIDVDDTIPPETKLDIAEAFSVKKKDRFRFVYPPELADYSKEVSLGSKALKMGDCKRAIAEFSKIAKGAKEYVSAKEMQAVAHLLAGEKDEAEKICLALLEDDPDDIRALATLAAVYLEQGRSDESKEIAYRLCERKIENTDDIYKVATVCCENGLHEQAYKTFRLLDDKMPYDGRMLYFQAVAAYKSGYEEETEKILDRLCTVYPDAEVAKYYLKALRSYRADEDGEIEKPEFTYFYHLPQNEREERCASLLKVGGMPKDEAQIFGLLVLHDGYFSWCFDEMDGADHDLQYLALATAVHVRADDFIQDVLLDFEVLDALKIETLRMLMERNEDMELGLVLCSIYREIFLPRIKIGRKRRAKYVEGYAKVGSKFVILSEMHGEKIKSAAETLYRALEKANALDLVDNTDDCACAIFMLSGLKELGNNPENVAYSFDANLAKTRVLMSYALGEYAIQNAETNTNNDGENA